MQQTGEGAEYRERSATSDLIDSLQALAAFHSSGFKIMKIHVPNQVHQSTLGHEVKGLSRLSRGYLIVARPAE